MSDRAADANYHSSEHFCAQVYIIVADNRPVMCCERCCCGLGLVLSLQGLFSEEDFQPSPEPSGFRCRVGILTHPLSKN
jgi:hypothetical protein